MTRVAQSRDLTRFETITDSLMFDRLIRLLAPSVCVALVWASASLSLAEERGVVIPGAGGEVRAGKSADAAVIATVKAGVPFAFEQDGEGEWANVTLPSGDRGWLPLTEIRLFYEQSDLPQKDPIGTSEIDEAAQALGFNYVAVTRKAAQGDAKALRRFFLLAEKADGGASESIQSIPTVVYHLLGDEKFARFLAAEPVRAQALTRSVILGDGRITPVIPYLQRHFPATTTVLFPSEIVGWSSPNGRYAIRKVFSDPLDLGKSKVVRAELVEKKTGATLLDFSEDDIGCGADREGDVVWAPDSKRFASLSTKINEEQANLFDDPPPAPHRKQTAVYQVTGDTWRRVELPLDRVPGRETDTELRGARLGHEHVEPAKWEKPNVLLLERHEYYRKVKPIESEGVKYDSIVDLSRWYWIKATINPEGEATLTWKVREE